jgi:hypothetical protein
MRNSNRPGNRLLASSSAERSVERTTQSWLPATTGTRVAMDPTRWSQRARQERYWQLIEIWNSLRTLH